MTTSLNSPLICLSASRPCCYPPAVKQKEGTTEGSVTPFPHVMFQCLNTMRNPPPDRAKLAHLVVSSLPADGDASPEHHSEGPPAVTASDQQSAAVFPQVLTGSGHPLDVRYTTDSVTTGSMDTERPCSFSPTQTH